MQKLATIWYIVLYSSYISVKFFLKEEKTRLSIHRQPVLKNRQKKATRTGELNKVVGYRDSTQNFVIFWYA